MLQNNVILTIVIRITKAFGIYSVLARRCADCPLSLQSRIHLFCLLFPQSGQTPTKFTAMAPQTKVQCFAVKDKKAKLERWEFEPVPLQPHDVGAASSS